MKQILFVFLCILSGYVYAGPVVSGQTYKISVAASGNKILTAKNSSLDSGTDVLVWTETGVNAQRWVLTTNDNTNYQLGNAYSGKILYRTGTAVDGAKICQYDRNDVSAGKWEIIPVENREGFVYIVQKNQAGTGNLYLEAQDTSDGSLVGLHAKKEGADAEFQIWKMEAVSAVPDYFTAAMRDAMMKGWKDYYYKKASSGYVLGKGGWWGDAEMFEVVLDAYETTGNPEYENMFRQLYTNFISRNRTDWSYNEYNDDIAWMVIASVRAHLMFGDQDYLNNAKTNFDRMYNRALLPSGMLRWKETAATINGTNSCINGPAEVASCYLAIATGTQDYYTKAKNLYALQRQYLYVPSTGQVYDSFTWNGDQPTNYNHWASTYNQGTFLGAALMLYNHFGDEQYKQDAQMIMKYTREKLCDQNGIISACQVATGDLAGFKGILMRYVRRFIVDMGQTTYVEWMQKNAFHAYNNRNSYGVSSSAWLTKANENFTFDNCTKDCSFANDPFGPSTAVSVAFNAPLDKNQIVKDAFSRIEAENFDYIKGVYVESGSDDATSQIGNIKGEYYTGYNNVNFGNNLAKSIEVRVSKGESRTTKMEIRLGSPTGALLGTISIPREGDEWQTVSCDLEQPLEGIQNIYFVYKGLAGSTNLFKFNYFQFTTNSYTYPDITDNGGVITSSCEASATQYGLNNLIDNRLSTEFHASVVSNPEGISIVYQSPAPATLKGYALGSAADVPEKDPKAWKLQASNDGQTWTDLDTQSTQTFEARYLKKQYDLSVASAYTYFRLYITGINGDPGEFQLSEWQLYGSCLRTNDITADGGELTAQYIGNESEETYVKLIDKSINSKYLVKDQANLWIDYKSNASYRLKSYSISSAEDAPERDPQSWIIYGSEDGKNWIEIDKQFNQKFSYRNVTHVYPCQVNAGYRYFRLHITANNGATMTQLSEWQLYGNYYYDRFYNDITFNGGELISSQDSEANSSKLKALIDNNESTIYTLGATDIGTSNPAWIQYKSTMPVQLRAYSIAVGDDENKNPRNWNLQGSNDGNQWTTIHTRSNISFSLHGERKEYPVSVSEKYAYFRINFTRLSSDEAREVKITEWELHGTGISTTDIMPDKTINSEYPGLNTGERVDRLADKSADTKYATNFSSSAWITYQSATPVKVSSYSITSANDNENRDPKTWTLEASNDGQEWILIDSRKNQQFPYRYVTQYFACNNEGNEYTHFRLNISENRGADILQLSEWQLLGLQIQSNNTKTIKANLLAKIYPNPVVDYLYVDMVENGYLQIYNLSGQIIHTQSVEKGVSTIAVSDYNKGIYFVRIKSDDKLLNQKFIKQ